MYHPVAGYEISRTYRYKNSNKVESAIFATRDFLQGDQIKNCCGVISELTDEDEEALQNDFSIMFSIKKNCTLQSWSGVYSIQLNRYVFVPGPSKVCKPRLQTKCQGNETNNHL